MLSSGSLRARIASVVDALSAAAAAQIASVVEEDMVLLRLEVRRREDDIRQLKSSIELLHGELRAAQRKDETRRPETQSDAGDGRSLSGQVRADDDHSFLPVPELQVKSEPVEEAGGPPDCAAYEAGRWTATTQNQIDCSSSDYVPLGQNLPGLAGSSVDGGSSLGYSQYGNLYSTVRRRTVKRLMFKKGFICPYCGKCFERGGHLERHKMIHTGEKPYRCEICGRRFNQNCSLKEHTKIHRRCLKSSLAEIQAEEQKHLPEVSLCEDTKNQEGRPKNDDSLSTPVQVKPEPAEEDAVDENIGGFDRDSQLWMSRLQKTSQQSIPSFPETDPLVQPPPPLPPPLHPPPPPPAPSYCSFSFPGKPYSQLKNSLISQTAFGPSDALMMSSDAASEGVAEASISLHPHRRSRSFQVIRPKKSFVCSYCGKIFERAGHLERHLRIHTGEKPYGCHICGRCFNQKSSLKGHMRTHRDGENSDLLEAPHLMFTLPDHHLLENLVEPENSLSAAEEPVSGGGGAVVVKLEPNGDDFPTESPGGPHGTDWRQLWTCGGQTSAETSEKTVCVLLQDVKYHDHPGRSDQLGYSPPIRTLPFVEQKELMPSQQFCVLGGPTTSDRHLVSEPQDPLRTLEENVSDRMQEGRGFEYNMEDACSRQNSFICSSCGQNFDHFHLFQRHQCESTSL